MITERLAAVQRAFERNRDKIMVPFQKAQEKARKKGNAVVRKYTKRRAKAEKGFKVCQLLRTRLYLALRGQRVERKRKNTSATMRMLGCTVVEFTDYIACFFAPGMSWDNHGEWELDHVKPCRAFDLTRPEEQNKCFHFSNFQPIWKGENRRKSDRWNGLRARDKK